MTCLHPDRSPDFFLFAPGDIARDPQRCQRRCERIGTFGASMVLLFQENLTLLATRHCSSAPGRQSMKTWVMMRVPLSFCTIPMPTWRKSPLSRFRRWLS